MVIQTDISCKWTSDSQHFLLEHFDAINATSFQIYHSALLFCPSSSWLQTHYSKELSQAIKVIKGVEAEWGSCYRTTALGSQPHALLYKNNTVAVGLNSSDIIMLDAITGSQTAVLSGHQGRVVSLVFSSDGRLLVSASIDGTVKLWDVQTGGIIRTFNGHTRDAFWSVSISADCTRIASASDEEKAYLWDIQTGECCCLIEYQGEVTYVGFSPTNPQYLITISDDKVQEWDTDCHQTGPTYNGSYIAFSPDSTQFALCNENVITVQTSGSGAILAKCQLPNGVFIRHCCFSPDGRLVAAASEATVYAWNISNLSFLLVGIFSSYTSHIESLVFSSPSTLISASSDESVKFWKIDTSSTDQVTTDLKFTPPASTPIMFVSLQPSEGIAISGDSAGVIETWDLTTGLSKGSFQTPAIEMSCGDAQLIDDKLLFIWSSHHLCHIWDSERGQLPEELDTVSPHGIRISGDGSKVFTLDWKDCVSRVQAWSVGTWGLVSEVELKIEGWNWKWHLDPFYTGGSTIWVQCWDLSIGGWDFGISGSSPMPLPNTLPKRPHLDFICYGSWKSGPSFVKNTITGKEVFRLSGKYAEPSRAQWDGRYLVTGYHGGDVLILDFENLPL